MKNYIEIDREIYTIQAQILGNGNIRYIPYVSTPITKRNVIQQFFDRIFARIPDVSRTRYIDEFGVYSFGKPLSCEYMTSVEDAKNALARYKALQLETYSKSVVSEFLIDDGADFNKKDKTN